MHITSKNQKLLKIKIIYINYITHDTTNNTYT